MAELVRIKALPGRMFPHPVRRGAFAGYAEVGKTEPADHRVPGGRSYRIRDDGEEIPSTVDVRRALAAGDIELFTSVIVTPAPAGDQSTDEER